MDGFYYAARKDLGVGGWGPGNSYDERIEKSVRIIGPSQKWSSQSYVTKFNSILLPDIVPYHFCKKKKLNEPRECLYSKGCKVKYFTPGAHLTPVPTKAPEGLSLIL